MTAATLIVIAAYSTTPTVVVLSMCIGVAFSGLLHSGYEVNILDIAPSLSGIVMGISNTFGTTTGFLSPLLVGYMTENKVSQVVLKIIDSFQPHVAFHRETSHLICTEYQVAGLYEIAILVCNGLMVLYLQRTCKPEYWMKLIFSRDAFLTIPLRVAKSSLQE